MLRRYNDLRLDLFNDTFRVADTLFDVFDSTSFKSKVSGDELTITIDLPGVKLHDLNLTFEGKIIKVNAVRETREIKHRLEVSSDYDLATATGTLSDGVLSIVVKKRTKASSNVIPIN